MAICYECGKQFYGYNCPRCGWEATYECWCCGTTIIPRDSVKCHSCGWFRCDFCEECGCNKDDRPLSNEEKIEDMGITLNDFWDT